MGSITHPTRLLHCSTHRKQSSDDAMSTQAYILLIDPFPARRMKLRDVLLKTGYRVKARADAMAAMPAVLEELPLLLIANIAFDEPGVLKRLRQQNQIPLILLLTTNDRYSEIAGFQMGADDVIAQPDNSEIFLARVSAMLNRTGARRDQVPEPEDETIVLGDLTVNPTSLSAFVGEEPVELSTREFMLLYTLAREAGSVVSRDELIEQVWGPDFSGETQTVYVYINWLRKKLKAHTQVSPRIITVHGVGYKLVRTDDLQKHP